MSEDYLSLDLHLCMCVPLSLSHVMTGRERERQIEEKKIYETLKK